MVNAMKLSILSNNTILYYDLKTVFCHAVVPHVKEHLFIYDFSLRGFYFDCFDRSCSYSCFLYQQS